MFLDELKRECDSCRRCELCESRNNIVFGVGNENADIMLIGEAPGENEDMQGQPFVGRSGKLLDEMIGEYGLSRDKNIYIANMLKCRPPKNRDPKPSEQNLCIEWLDRQIEIIDPKIIVYCVACPRFRLFASWNGRLYSAPKVWNCGTLCSFAHRVVHGILSYVYRQGRTQHKAVRACRRFLFASCFVCLRVRNCYADTDCSLCV